VRALVCAGIVGQAIQKPCAEAASPRWGSRHVYSLQAAAAADAHSGSASLQS
jgi:hypothetical protein